MFDKKAFKRMAEDKGFTLEEVAKELGISKVTLYRKMSGESDFYRHEMKAIRDLFQEENMDQIFFANVVA